MSNVCNSAVIHMGADSKKHIMDFQSILAKHVTAPLGKYSADELKTINNDLIIHIGRSEYHLPNAAA